MSNRILFTFLFFLLFIISIRIAFFYAHKTTYSDGQKIEIISSITSEPKIESRAQRFRIALQNGDHIYITAQKFPLYAYGHKIKIEGVLEMVKTNNNILPTLRYPHIQLIEETNRIKIFAKSVRKSATRLYSSVLNPDQSALMLGIVFGIKQGMSDWYYDNLQKAGLLHVIAASGMNVSIIAGALLGIFERLLSRKVAILFTVVCVCFYAILAGLEPSIVRATVMALLSFLAALFGKQKHAVYLLYLTGVIMLFYQPYLLFDIGFQLSFLATAGILLIKPFLSKINFTKKGEIIKEDLTTTVAAQVTTLPIILTNFGSVNLLSVLANILVLWTVPILMMIGGISMLISFIVFPLGQLLLFLSVPLLFYFEKVITLCGFLQIPLQLESSSIVLWVGYYLILIAFVWFKEIAIRDKGNK